MKATRAILCACILCLCSSAAQGQSVPYIGAGVVNLAALLAPPPAAADLRTAEEIRELQHLQGTAAAARLSLAKADVEESVFRLLTVFDRRVTPEQLPITAAFFRKLTADGAPFIGAAKKHFGRLRPYAVAKDFAPICPRDTVDNRSYPSGHTSVGYLMGVVLATMMPEKKEAIFVRTQEYAESRLYCGVHYRSDIEAGRIAGTVLAAVAMNNAEFQRDFTATKAELRAALGY